MFDRIALLQEAMNRAKAGSSILTQPYITEKVEFYVEKGVLTEDDKEKIIGDDDIIA